MPSTPQLIIEPYLKHTPSMLSRLQRVAAAHPPDLVVVGALVWFVQWLREVLRRPLAHAYLQPTRWLASNQARRTREPRDPVLPVAAAAPPAWP